MPHLSLSELNLICSKFGVIIGGRHDVNYNAFCFLVEEYAQTKWTEKWRTGSRLCVHVHLFYSFWFEKPSTHVLTRGYTSTHKIRVQTRPRYDGTYPAPSLLTNNDQVIYFSCPETFVALLPQTIGRKICQYSFSNRWECCHSLARCKIAQEVCIYIYIGSICKHRVVGSNPHKGWGSNFPFANDYTVSFCCYYSNEDVG